MKGHHVNTSRVSGLASGIYGVGPTRVSLATDRYPFVSDFVSAVGRAASGYAITGGTFGAPEDLRRYVVGGFADATVIRANPERSHAQSAALLFVEQNREALSRGFVLGFWVDEDTRRTWLDVCYSYQHAQQAENAGRENGEIAIYDRETGNVIGLS